MEKIRSWPVLRTVREVRQFLGLANYYREFMPDYARLAFPLQELITKAGPQCKHNQKVSWTVGCQVAFDALKMPLLVRQC